MLKHYMCLGIVLLVIGFSLASVSYFVIASVSLTAIGLSIILLGLTSITTTLTRQTIPMESKRINISTKLLLISLAVIFGIIDIVLMLFYQEDLAIYFVINAIAYFITIWFYSALNPKLRNSLTFVSAIIFSIFLLIIAFKIINIVNI
jgi:hypothetical protein